MRYISLLGLLAMILIAFLLSENKRKIRLRTVIWGVVIQFVFALLILKTAPGKAVFKFMNDVIVKLLSFTETGSAFIFGSLITETSKFGYIFAFQVLPTIIFFASLMGILYYLGIMQWVVEIFAKIMAKFMGTSGSESLCASSNIFIGQTEAPLLVKPYVHRMTKSELLAIMVCGMATVAGGVMAAYVGMLKDYFPDIAGHLLAASIMSAPAALVIAKLMIPEIETSETMGKVKVHIPKTDANIIDAAANGAYTGLHLALNVGAMLLAFIALITMFNFGLNGIGNLINNFFGTHLDLTFEKLFGWIFAPIAWIMGVPWKDCVPIGELLGIKLVLNEFVAYSEFGKMFRDGIQHLDPRSVVIATYALCGFANFSSIAIQIGGIGGIAPNRRHDLAKLGIKAVIGGTLACFMTATIAGVLVTETTLVQPKKEESLKPKKTIVCRIDQKQLQEIRQFNIVN